MSAGRFEPTVARAPAKTRARPERPPEARRGGGDSAWLTNGMRLSEQQAEAPRHGRSEPVKPLWHKPREPKRHRDDPGEQDAKISLLPIAHGAQIVPHEPGRYRDFFKNGNARFRTLIMGLFFWPPGRLHISVLIFPPPASSPSIPASTARSQPGPPLRPPAGASAPRASGRKTSPPPAGSP